MLFPFTAVLLSECFFYSFVFIFYLTNHFVLSKIILSIVVIFLSLILIVFLIHSSQSFPLTISLYPSMLALVMREAGTLNAI